MQMWYNPLIMQRSVRFYMLSIIIPVHNVENWLNHCLTSILTSVSESSDYEILLIDDGSTDRSGIICDHFANSNRNIRVRHTQQSGVAAARNAGLELACGEYICWVDSDDYVSPDWYSSITDVLSAEKPDILVFDTTRFDNNSESYEIYGRAPGQVNRDLFYSDVMRDIRMLSGLPNKVFKASLFADMRFDPELPLLEDFAAMPRLLESAQSVYYLPKRLYYYRQHNSSLLHHVTPERAFLSFKIAQKRAEEVSSQFRIAAETAAAIQAYTFCRNQHLYDGFHADKQQLHLCKSYVRNRLFAICKESETPNLWKMKLVLLALGFSKPLKKNS